MAKYNQFGVAEEEEEKAGKYGSFQAPGEEAAPDPSAPTLPSSYVPPTLWQETKAVGRDLGESAAAAGLNALQAPTLGWFDEMTSGTELGRSAEQFRQERNEQYPGAGALAEGSAGLLLGARGAPKAFSAISGAMPAPWMAALGNMSAGGALAALYGAGKSDPGERGTDAAIEGGIGFFGGPFINAAGRVAHSAFSPLIEAGKDLFRSVDDQAARTIGRYISESGQPTDIPAQTSRQAAVDVPPGESPYINADLDPAQTQQLKKTYDENPEIRGQVEDTLTQRQRQTPVRVVDDIASVTNLDRDTRKLQEQLLRDSKKQMAKAGYTELADQNIPLSDNLFDMFTGPEAPYLRRAYKNAEGIAAREGNPIPPYDQVFGEDGTLEGIPFHAFDYMQRAFRNAGKPNIANPTYDNVSWRKLRERFISEIDEAAPDFATVRRNYATASSIEDAARQGRDIYKMGDARDIAEYLQTLSFQEQAAFRRGAIDAVEDQVRNLGVKSGNVDTRLAGTQNKDEILDVVFGDNAESVRGILNREDIFNRTYSSVLGNSNTSKNLGGAEGISIPFRGQGLGEVVTEQVARTAQNAFEPNEQVVRSVINMLLKQGYTEKEARRIATQQMGQQGAGLFGQQAQGAALMTLPGPLGSLFTGE